MILPITAALGLLTPPVHNAAPAWMYTDQLSVLKLDAVSLKGRGPAANPLLDVYVAMPYEHLQFTPYDGSFVGEYTLRIRIRDTVGTTYIDTSLTKTIVESSYTVVRGKTGKSDNTQRRFTLPAGIYVIDVQARDVFGQKTYSAEQRQTVYDLNAEADALSSILYLSEIEQRGNRYTIIPYIGEQMWSNDQRLFAFFEYYTSSIRSLVGFTWDISSSDMRALASGSAEPMRPTGQATQAFVPIVLAGRLIPGEYTLTIRAHPVIADGAVDTTDVLASTSRAYHVPQSMAGELLKDLRKAIKQLIYVTGQDTIDSLLAASTDGERLTRFENFWKSIDPTPNSAKNEALEEYYGRIEVANERFRSYNEGWLTDMGRVYIIYGEPLTVERLLGQNRLTVFSRWTYPNGVVVTFEDPSGFGDFRLRSTLPGNPKYEYRRAGR
jgi:GWxTD domain-containing protein